MSTSNTKWFKFFIFKNGKILLIFCVFCLVASAILGSLMPKLISQLALVYDEDHKFFNTLKNLTWLFIGVYANRVLYQLMINKYVQHLMQRARVMCFEQWLHVYDLHTGEVDHKDEYPQGEVIARIMNDTESIRELMTSGSFGILIDLFFVISCLVSFISINQTSGVFLGGAEIIAACFLVWGSKHMRDIFLSVRKSRGNMSRTLANLVGGVRDTFYTRHDQYAVKRGVVDFDDFLKKILYSNVWDAGYYSLAESLYPILLALVVFIFPYSEITQAAIIFAIVDLIQRSIGPIKDVSAKIANIQRAISGMIRIQEFLDDLSRGHSTLNSFSHDESREKEIIDYQVKVNHFSYPERKSEDQGKKNSFKLSQINFHAKKGELLGIVGTSGCGKSTLFNILAGNILLRDGDIQATLSKGEKLNISGGQSQNIIEYRKLIGLISQESHLFSETVRFNITLSFENDPQILESFDRFWGWVVEQIPYIKTWGITPDYKLDIKKISLGQRQLLAAVRACFLKKPIVLFDEISSGLDSELELALRKMVLLIQENALTFIVAHRMETILEADQILVMKDGEIVDRGRHIELSKSSSYYNEFLAEISHSSSN